MNGMTEILLVGCGRWGRFVLRDLGALGCRVVVVARSEESRQRALHGGAADVVPGLRELPLSYRPHGVVVVTPSATHYTVIREVLEQFPGVPVFVEKSLTVSLGDARDLVARASGTLFVMDKWRYHPGIIGLREVVASGELGAPLGMKTRRLQWGSPHVDVDPVWILLPHDLAIALEVFGAIPPPRSARADRIGEVLHGMYALLGSSPWLSIEISGRVPEHVRDVTLFCEGGSARLDDAYASELQVIRSLPARYGDAVEVERRVLSSTMPLEAELRAFIAYLRDGGDPPRSSAEEGMTIVGVIEELRALATNELRSR
jgi:predicted dehydrogenase